MARVVGASGLSAASRIETLGAPPGASFEGTVTVKVPSRQTAARSSAA
ncbi:MAG: hypothetical protein IPF82_17870 [Blastocatellia bacterium]|nr:hypothetical protein [Blastocatellia bacterium]